jgi:hypothetical protein
MLSCTSRNLIRQTAPYLDAFIYGLNESRVNGFDLLACLLIDVRGQRGLGQASGQACPGVPITHPVPTRPRPIQVLTASVFGPLT